MRVTNSAGPHIDSEPMLVSDLMHFMKVLLLPAAHIMIVEEFWAGKNCFVTEQNAF